MNDTTSQDKANANPNEQREKNGQFKAGNDGGPGNPHARQVAGLKAMMLQIVDQAMLRDIILKMCELAKGGSVPAAKLILNYTLGKPDQGVTPDRVEVDEWKLREDSTVGPKEFERTVKLYPAYFANPMADVLGRMYTDNQRAKLHAGASTMLNDLNERTAAKERQEEETRRGGDKEKEGRHQTGFSDGDPQFTRHQTAIFERETGIEVLPAVDVAAEKEPRRTAPR